MQTIWIPILAIGALILLFWLTKSDSTHEKSDNFGCGMGCCGRKINKKSG